MKNGNIVLCKLKYLETNENCAPPRAGAWPGRKADAGKAALDIRNGTVQAEEKIRDELLRAYEGLTPPEQALAQLCSIIWEPVSIPVLYKIFRRSGLSFPGEKVNSGKALEPHLNKLQALKLLNDNLEVPQSIVEIITRRAVAEGRIFNAADMLKGIESEQAWKDAPTNGSACLSCAKPIREKAFITEPGPLCPSCAAAEIRNIAANENMDQWPAKQILDSLSPGANIRSRLTVIWNFSEAHMSLVDRSHPNASNLLSLLVQNLGYIESHPLAPTVRQAALRTCTQMSYRVLPLLLKMVKKEPWQYYVNVLMALGTISSERAEVQALLKEGSNDPRPEVRKFVMTFLSQNPPAWALQIITKLCGDEDFTIRSMAKTALAELKKTKRRYPLFSSSAQAIPDTPVGVSIRFGPLVKAVQEELPLSRQYYYSYGSSQCPRIMRDLRIGIYARDKDMFFRRRDDLASHCGSLSDYSSAIAQICNSPFDAAWFATLPIEIQTFSLSSIFYQAMEDLEPDADALAYALKTSLFESAPPAERGTLFYNLTSRLIMGGRLDEAGKMLPNIEGGDYTGGLKGWIRFVEGRNDEAIASFEADLKELRRRAGKRNINFSGFAGIFYVLSLLKAESADLLKKAEQLTNWNLSHDGILSSTSSLFESLQGIIHAQKLEVEEAKRSIALQSRAPSPIPTLMNAIAAYWINGHLPKGTTEKISELFPSARDAGVDWAAMECAALLIRAKKGTPEHTEYLDRVMKQSGMQSIVYSLKIEETWQKGLRALIEIAEAPEEATGKKSAATRLIWLVGFEGKEVSLQPLEQKFTARGGWSKGRPVSLGRLFNRTKLDYITEKDHAICASLKRDQSYYYGDSYTFDMNKLLPALVDHPLLFRDKSPTTPVEFIKGEPEIVVAKSSSSLNIRFKARFGEDRFMVIQETPTRFKVIEISNQHRRIAQVLGEKGLIAPISARQDVLDAITALSSHVLVHSDVGVKSKDVEEVASDPTPHAHLLPSGPGFRVEVFVKPFKEEGSPYLKPGVGAANVIAEVGGKRMQTRRDLKAEENMANTVEAVSTTLSRLADSDRQWQLDDPEDCLQVLLDLKALQEKGEVSVEWPEGEKLKVTREMSLDQLRMKIRGKTDWFEVSGGLQVDDNLVLDMKRLLELIKTSDTRFIPLEEGHFLALTKEFRKRLEELDSYAERKGKEVRLHPLAAMAVQDLMEAIPNLEVDKAWKSRLERIQTGQKIKPPIPSTLKAELRDYQVEGYTWMARLAHMGIGACLADDMGLGKTIQTLAVMLHRATQGPMLVVAPTSVCWNWVNEANRFAPTLNVVQFDSGNREEIVKGLQHQDVLVTSYGLLIQEAELLSTVEWNLIVLDEAQAIKNVLTKRSQAAMGLKGNFKIITTGTPIENHLGEFWTLFNFINPGLLGSIQKFNERFAIPIEKYNNRDAKKRLKKLIQPFILRRLKSQVLEELPPRTEVVLQVEMSPEETAFYEALRRQALERIEADNAPVAQKHLKILAEITKLRQAACNPRLVMAETTLSSSKLELFGDVVSELLENRHKALVFSQFVGHLSLIREHLDSRNISYRYLDGSTSPKDRRKEVDAFQSGEGDLFLISLKAGGLGLNLTAADYVIHMDPWWNPAVEDQASDRAHRIGQQHPVTVYRLVAKGTIEEKIVRLHQEKRDLAGSLLDGSDVSGKISAEELIRLIREE